MDVERLRARRQLARIAERSFPAAVAAAVLAAADEAERLERFYRFWTAYEAFAKALGAGLALPARELAVSAGSEPDELVLSHPAAGDEPWAGRHVPLAGAIACVVTSAPRCTVTRRTARG